MKTEEFEFSFIHQRKHFTGNLQIMSPFKTKMYRVYVEKTQGFRESVFIFYEVNEEKQRFFYFPLVNYEAESMAKSILKELSKY